MQQLRNARQKPPSTSAAYRIDGRFVIARNTAFTYKGKPADIGQIGCDLGVRYLLQGSVRRTGNHVRANVQPLDAETGSHLGQKRAPCGTGLQSIRRRKWFSGADCCCCYCTLRKLRAVQLTWCSILLGPNCFGGLLMSPDRGLRSLAAHAASGIVRVPVSSQAPSSRLPTPCIRRLFLAAVVRP